MEKSVTIIDYGIGNIFSVSRAFEKFGANVYLARTPEDILRASRLVLPGVGAFASGMTELNRRELIGAIKEYVKSGKPLLGICLGMQLLFSESIEFGSQTGLGIFQGKVLPLEPKDEGGQLMRVPHIGWNDILTVYDNGGWESSILRGVNPGASCYFVHSFTAFPVDEKIRLADSYYGSARIAAVVARDNITGCQFHPEKSGPIGLKMINNFLEI